MLFQTCILFFVGIIVLYLQIIVTMDCQGTKRQSGEQLWVQCLAQGHLSRGIKGGESAVHSLPPPTIPAGPRLKLATF